MNSFVRLCSRFIIAASIALTGLALSGVPTASAAPAPWTWVHVERTVSVAPNTSYSEDVYCPAGYTAITGGLKLPTSSGLERRGEYREWDGSFYRINFSNMSPYSGSAILVVECARTSDLPTFTHHYAQFSVSGFYDKTVSCPDAGQVAVTGGLDWSNHTSVRINSFGPVFTGNGWRVQGVRNASTATLTLEVYCVDAAQVPGLAYVEAPHGLGTNVVTCPRGTRILNGGSQGGYANSSYPTLNKWTSADEQRIYSQRSAYIRAWCVSAGSPTVGFVATPSPVVSNVTGSHFQFAGSDPAGFGNGFRCSLDGGAPTPCDSFYRALALPSGPHFLTVFNETADGRTSNVIRHDWVVDDVAPTVTAPEIPQVALNGRPQVSWTATDQHSAVSYYEAAYWRVNAAGIAPGWATPSEWSGLATPSVQLPAMTAGETICVSVRAVDLASNRSPWTAPRCVSRPLDDRALTAGRAWERGTGSQYWNQTVTSTVKMGKTLRLADVTLDQVGIVAAVCPTCGKVDVAIDGTVIRRVNLERPTTAHKKVVLLPAFSLRTGDVTVTTVTSDKPVRIDGLVIANSTTTTP